MIKTTDQLIADIKVRGSIPTSQDRFTDARFLSLANADMTTKILPLVLASRENFYEYDIDTTINATGLYPLSTRAYLGLLSNVALVTSDRRYDIPLLSEELETDLDKPQRSKAGFILKRNTVQLKPKAGGNYDSLRLTIILRPGSFVVSAETAEIQSISGSVLTFTSGDIPTAWTSTNTFDLVQANPHYDHLSLDLAATVDSVTQITLASTPDSRLAAGDRICLAEESSIIQCPEGFAYLLSQRVANTCMRAMGDVNGHQGGELLAQEMEKDLKDAINPRVHKEAKKIVSNNSMLRRNGISRQNI